MNKDKKYKVKFSDQVRGTFDKLLDKKDRENFEILAKAIQKIVKDPSQGNPVVSGKNKELLSKINSYKSEKIKVCKMSWDVSMVYDEPCPEHIRLEDNLDDLLLKINREGLLLFGACILQEGRRIFSKDLGRKLNGKEVYLDLVEHKEPCYMTHLSSEDLGKFFIKSYAISLNPPFQD